MRPVRTAVIPAGGLGTRFLPFSRSAPKELLPLVDTPVIDVVVSECAAAGIERVILVVGPGKDALAAYFGESPRVEARLRAEGRSAELGALRRPQTLAKIEVVQQDEPRGNGDAVLVAREAVGDEPFAMLWADDIVFGPTPALAQMLEARERLGGSVAGAARFDREQAARYGVFSGRPERGAFRVTAILEKPTPAEAPSDLAGVHGYVLEPAVFDVLAAQPTGRGGELWLSEAVGRLAATHPVWAVELAGERYDAGDRAGYVTAFVERALARDDVGEALRAYLRRRGWTPPRA